MLRLDIVKRSERIVVFALLQKPPRLIKLGAIRLRWIGLGQVDRSRRLLREPDLRERNDWGHKQQKQPTNKVLHGKIRNRYPEKIRTRFPAQGQTRITAHRQEACDSDAATLLCSRHVLDFSPYRALRRNPIGIGGAVARSPLPHHPTCGSASGGSEGYASPANKRGRPSESK